MPTDLLGRLQADPGTRTFGELVQERQWALQEIHRLRALLAREETARSRYVQRSEKRPKEEADPTDKPRIHPAQFLSLAEITKHFDLSRSTILGNIRLDQELQVRSLFCYGSIGTKR